jgi:hypothetical protein
MPTIFITSALGGGKQRASSRGCFFARELAAGTYPIGGSMFCVDSLDISASASNLLLTDGSSSP